MLIKGMTSDMLAKVSSFDVDFDYCGGSQLFVLIIPQHACASHVLGKNCDKKIFDWKFCVDADSPVIFVS